MKNKLSLILLAMVFAGLITMFADPITAFALPDGSKGPNCSQCHGGPSSSPAPPPTTAACTRPTPAPTPDPTPSPDPTPPPAPNPPPAPVSPVNCTYSLSSASNALGPDAGSGSVNVTAGPNCSWTASTNSGSWGWIAITSGWNGTGNGTVNYIVLANDTGSTRSGFLTIAGQTFTITQQSGGGGGCTVLFSLFCQQHLRPGAGSGSVNITAGPNCSWTASTNSGSWDWIGISSGWNGTGNGTVDYFVLANNTGKSRTGTLAIAGQTFTITQQAIGHVPCNSQHQLRLQTPTFRSLR